jgi:hypothetical protein
VAKYHTVLGVGTVGEMVPVEVPTAVQAGLTVRQYPTLRELAPAIMGMDKPGQWVVQGKPEGPRKGSAEALDSPFELLQR